MPSSQPDGHGNHPIERALDVSSPLRTLLRFVWSDYKDSTVYKTWTSF
jgi:hypothetical protein